MKRSLTIMFSMGVLALVTTSAWSAVGKAKIAGTAEGTKIAGVVTFEDTKEGLKISAQLENIPPGDHGFHIHDFGDCGDVGKNAGGHYNPEDKPHGHVIKDGLGKSHVGDLGNVTIGQDGTGKLEATIPGVSLSGGKLSVGGRAIILHEKADDFGQPVGNAGGRIGCGAILITGK